MTQLQDPVTLRQMEPSDLDGVTRFLEHLSNESLYHRFFTRGRSGLLFEIGYLRSLDGSDRAAVVAEADGEIVGLARYHRTDLGHAEVAVVVADAWQQHGVGRRLLRALVSLARDHEVEMIDVSMLGDNLAALRLLRGLAGRPALHLDHGVFEATIPLAG